MNEFSDQNLAFWMLENRAYGYTFRLHFRRSAWRYALVFGLFGLVGLALGVMESIGPPPFSPPLPLASCVACFGCGAFVCDIAWVRMHKRVWPFREKVTDWSVVEKIAGGEMPV